MLKSKVVVLGPEESGKSLLANFLSDAKDASVTNYRPTQGVRILEFQVQANSSSVEVELWDVSGSNRYEPCWPAISRDTAAMLFVFNPNKKNQEVELEKLYRTFAEWSSLPYSSCLVCSFATRRNDPQLSAIPVSMSQIASVHSSREDSGDEIREQFTRLISRALDTVSQKRDQQELSVIDN